MGQYEYRNSTNQRLDRYALVDEEREMSYVERMDWRASCC